MFYAREYITNIATTMLDYYKDEYGVEHVTLHFERPSDAGFDFADLEMPSRYWRRAFGFNEEELLERIDYANRNFDIMLDILREEWPDVT